MSTDPESRGGFGPYLSGVGPTYKDQDGTFQTIRYGHIEDFKRALDYFGKNVAAFLLEPIQGEAGYVHPKSCVQPLSDCALEASSFHQRGIFVKFASCARKGMFSLSAMKSRRLVRLSPATPSEADNRYLTIGFGTDWEDALLRARGYPARYSFIGQGTIWRRSVEILFRR